MIPLTVEAMTAGFDRWRRVFARPTRRADLRAAQRTLVYGLGSALVRRLKPRPTAAQRQVLWEFWREAFELQRQMLRRPEVEAALATLERSDLYDLPSFALMLPVDLWRAARKRSGATMVVRPTDDYPYPNYYLHDFHNQANGGLSTRAAVTYEWQIRLLFAGTNRLMRQALIDRIPAGDHLRILDVGCGTAAWLPQARLQGRAHHVTGIDLSPHYLAYARRRADPAAVFTQGNAEHLNYDRAFDCVVCIWVYHELPPAARQHVTDSLRRALKPGGVLLFMDALQQSDIPERDLTFMNQRFAQDFDEPYFSSYQQLDISPHLKAAGLQAVASERVFVSKLVEARRQERER